MASLNTSTNGPSISSSYQKIVNSPPPSGPAASSPTYGQWAVFAVQAPLANAFQPDPSKESVLKVQTTGEGELVDMIEDFSDGKIQFGFVKVKDTNSGLPKCVLICWCGEGVPERTKGYFTSHMNAVSKLLHGYHVQITARSEEHLTPEGIVQKVADSSGSKYGGGSGDVPAPAPSGQRPPVATKPIMPTKSFGTTGSYSMGGRTRAPAPASKVDEDGWGEDAPPVTRSQLEKVGSAYQPTKVDMASLQSGHDASRSKGDTAPSDPNVVKGGYQPIGKVDINAIRQQAQQSQDDRPTVVKGAYEPVGKVDIADIRRKAQGNAAPSQPSPPPAPSANEGEEDDRPKSLAERSAAFSTSERMTSLPKPKVANRFGSQTSSFAGTKAPTPGGFESKPVASAAPIGAAGRTFADSAGKTPAQQWAERKARERGNSGAAETLSPAHTGAPAAASPIQSQQSGGWQSGYTGKKWGAVQMPTRTGGSGISEQKTGQDEPEQQQQQEENDAPSGGFGSIRDRFKEAPPMGAPQPPSAREPPSAPEPPPLDTASKPNAGGRGVPIPGMPPPPPQPQPQDDEEDDLPPPPPRPQFEGHPTQEHVNMPPPPPRPVPADEQSDDEGDIPQGQGSPIPIARPVARGASPEPLEKAETRSPPPPMPTESIAQAASHMQAAEPEPQVEEEDPARGAGQAAAAGTFGADQDVHAGSTNSAGHEAIAQYDYEKAEDNELELREGERVFNIDMVDEDWWMGENTRGEKGLFPSNYVELVEGGGAAAAAAPPAPAPVQETAPPPPAPAAAPAAAGGKTATAQYDYQAAEDNELTFPDGAKVTGIVSCGD